MKKIICGIVYAVLCFAAGAAVAAMSGTSWSTTTYDDGKNREVVISNDVTEISASGLITVSKNSKLLIRLNDNVDHDVTIKLSKKNTAGFLSLDSGATVQVKGNADHRIVLDGGAAFPEEPRAEDVDELGRPNNPQALRFYSTTGHKIDNSFIRCSGKATLDLNGVIVQNVYHYSDEDKESKPGGGHTFHEGATGLCQSHELRHSQVPCEIGRGDSRPHQHIGHLDDSRYGHQLVREYG